MSIANLLNPVKDQGAAEETNDKPKFQIAQQPAEENEEVIDVIYDKVSRA